MHRKASNIEVLRKYVEGAKIERQKLMGRRYLEDIEDTDTRDSTGVGVEERESRDKTEEEVSDKGEKMQLELELKVEVDKGGKEEVSEVKEFK